MDAMDNMNIIFNNAESRFVPVEPVVPIEWRVAPRVAVIRVVYPRSWLRRLLHLPARYRRYSVPEDLDQSA